MTPPPPTEMRLVVPRCPDRRQLHLIGGAGADWSDSNRRCQAERRHRDADIERTEALHSAIVEGVPEALAVLDVQGTVVFVNPAFEQLFGYGSGALADASFQRLLPVAGKAAFSGWCRQCAALAQPLRTMQLGRRRDGTEFPLELALNPLATAYRRLVVASVRDITEHRHALEALRQQSLQLTAANIRLRAQLEILLNASGRHPDEPGT